MSPFPPTLHILCGKIASGKSTLAVELATLPATVLVAEEAWLTALYPDELKTLGDYARCSSRLRVAIAPYITALLNAGLSVVLDFPANTIVQRNWCRGLLEETNAVPRLHFLDTPDDACLSRLRVRNARVEQPFSVTEEYFHRVTAHFVAPSPDEGFDFIVYKDSGTPIQ